MIAVVHESAQVTQADMRDLCRACAMQLEHHFATDYYRLAPDVVYYRSATDVPQGAPTIRVVDTSDDLGAYGYHTQRGGLVVGLVGVTDVFQMGGTVAQGAVSVSAVLSHECLEASFDPYCNKWTEDGSGRLWASELADPCQGSYYLMDGIAVSNYVRPAFWNAQASTLDGYDRLNTLHAPFTIAEDGYAVLRNPDGTTQELGAKAAWKKGFRSAARRGRIP